MPGVLGSSRKYRGRKGFSGEKISWRRRQQWGRESLPLEACLRGMGERTTSSQVDSNRLFNLFLNGRAVEVRKKKRREIGGERSSTNSGSTCLGGEGEKVDYRCTLFRSLSAYRDRHREKNKETMTITRP